MTGVLLLGGATRRFGSKALARVGRERLAERARRPLGEPCAALRAPAAAPRADRSAGAYLAAALPALERRLAAREPASRDPFAGLDAAVVAAGEAPATDADTPAGVRAVRCV